jgi:hypothetical protein
LNLCTEQNDRILKVTNRVRQKPWLIKTGVFVFVPHYVQQPEYIIFDVGFVSLLLRYDFSKLHLSSRAQVHKHRQND